MLTLQQYLNQFVRKDFTIELRRLIRELGITRQRIWAISNGSSSSAELALAIYRATDGRVDPRTVATKFDWQAMDAYYQAEHGLTVGKTNVAAARRATSKAAAKKAAMPAKKTVARVARAKPAKR